MCGIAGFISKEKNAPIGEREHLLDEMCRVSHIADRTNKARLSKTKPRSECAGFRSLI